MQTPAAVVGCLWIAIILCCSLPSLAADVRLTPTGGDCSGKASAGTLEVYDGSDWRPVCAEGFGSLEGQVACRQLGYPFVVGITSDTTAGASEYSGFVESVSCTGSEANITECTVETEDQCNSGTQSTNDTVILICDDANNSTEGLALILFEESGTQYSLIAPNVNIYKDDCAYTSTSSCYGAHIFFEDDAGIILSFISTGMITDCSSDTIDVDGLLDNCANPVSTCSPRDSGAVEGSKVALLLMLMVLAIGYAV